MNAWPRASNYLFERRERRPVEPSISNHPIPLASGVDSRRCPIERTEIGELLRSYRMMDVC